MHEYKRRLLLAIARGSIPTVPGTVLEMAVRHDAWCGLYAGQECWCDPEIEIRTEHGVIRIDREGAAKPAPCRPGVAAASNGPPSPNAFHNSAEAGSGKPRQPRAGEDRSDD